MGASINSTKHTATIHGNHPLHPRLRFHHKTSATVSLHSGATRLRHPSACLHQPHLSRHHLRLLLQCKPPWHLHLTHAHLAVCKRHRHVPPYRNGNHHTTSMPGTQTASTQLPHDFVQTAEHWDNRQVFGLAEPAPVRTSHTTHHSEQNSWTTRCQCTSRGILTPQLVVILAALRSARTRPPHHLQQTG